MKWSEMSFEGGMKKEAGREGDFIAGSRLVQSSFVAREKRVQSKS
jgi:hypothetical protein